MKIKKDSKSFLRNIMRHEMSVSLACHYRIIYSAIHAAAKGDNLSGLLQVITDEAIHN